MLARSPVNSISAAQQIYLNLIDASGHWNDFDGPRIASDLRKHIHLWRSAVVLRLPRVLRGTPITELQHSVDLIALRDLCEGHINLDCVFILPEPAQQEELERLALQWSPDEVVWIPRREAAKAMGMSKLKMSDFALDEQMFLLKLWWD
jgi:hypothetical protein